MAASGRTKAWKKIFEGNNEVPLAYDRQQESSTDSLPYYLSVRTLEVSNAKVNDQNFPVTVGENRPFWVIQA